MANRYLQDKAMRRMRTYDRGMDMNMGYMDGRNPYGSRGGYVMSSRGRGRDRGMDYGNYNSEYDSRNSYPMDYNYRGQDSHHGGQYYGEPYRPMEYPMMGMYPYDMGMDYGKEEKEYREHLHKWTEKLKKKDRFRKEKPEIIQMARSMGAKFDNYDEDEFVAIYYMTVSDIRNELIPSPQQAVLYAIDWIEDDDVEMKGSDKVCSYLYATVLGKMDD